MEESHVYGLRLWLLQVPSDRYIVQVAPYSRTSNVEQPLDCIISLGFRQLLA